MKTISSPARAVGRALLVRPARVVIRPVKTLTIRRQRLTAPKVSILRRRSAT